MKFTIFQFYILSFLLIQCLTISIKNKNIVVEELKNDVDYLTEKEKEIEEKEVTSSNQSEDPAIMKRIKRKEEEISNYIKEIKRKEEGTKPESTADTHPSKVVFDVNGQETDTITNTTDDLELFSSKEPVKDNFTVHLKIEKMKEQGYLILGFNRDEKAKKSEKYFADGNENGWGIGSNGYILEYGKWAKLPSLFLNQGDVVTFKRINYVLTIYVNGEYNTYGYLMEGDLYLTVNLKTKGDSIKIVESSKISKINEK